MMSSAISLVSPSVRERPRCRMSRASRCGPDVVPGGPGRPCLVPGTAREDTATVSFRSLRLLAAGAAALSVAGIVLAALIPGYFGTYVDGHLFVNATLGLAYALIGGLVAWARPRNAI